MKIYVGKDDNGTICLFNNKPIQRTNYRAEHEWIPDPALQEHYVDISEILEEGVNLIEVELPDLEETDKELE